MIAIVATAMAAAVTPAGAAVDRGRPACDYCRMVFTRPQFGGEIRTADGRRLIFDAAECMAAYCLRQARTTDLVAVRAVRYDAPAARIDVHRAWFVRSDSLESPMGLNLAAFATHRRAQAEAKRTRGRVLSWRSVVTLVDTTWFRKPGP